jgi:hypothetical protein
VLALGSSVVACADGPPGPAGPSGGGKGDYVGEDDRTQIGDATDPRVARWAPSVGLMMRASKLEARGDGAYRARTNTLGSERELCSDERFADEPVLGFCSSWLVGPDLLATAGHCVTNHLCEDIAVVFDFHSTGASANPDRIPADRVFRCESIVAREYEEGGRDYALIRLDRAALGRIPFAVDATPPSIGTAVATIGFPYGIYAKADLGGRLLRHTDTKIETTLDTFPGNSGSVVLDLDTGHAFAIHTEGGQHNFVLDGSCMRTASCTTADVEAGTCTPSIERLADGFASGIGTPPTPDAPTSCGGRCGDQDAQGCDCDLACVDRGDCCDDMSDVCSASPTGPACIEPGGPCDTASDCAPMSCTCEGVNLVTESFQAAPGRCNDGTCSGDPYAACRAACIDQGFTPLAWGTSCYWD